MKRFSISMIVCFLMSSVAMAERISIKDQVRRIYVSNEHATLHVVDHARTGCPWGLIISEDARAYDRWLSQLMTAYVNELDLKIEYDDSNCNILTVALEK